MTINVFIFFSGNRAYTIITPVFLPLESRSWDTSMHIDVLGIYEYTLGHVLESEISDETRLVSRILESASASRRYACKARQGKATRRRAPFQCRSIYPSGSRRQSQAWRFSFLNTRAIYPYILDAVRFKSCRYYGRVKTITRCEGNFTGSES